MVFKLAFSLFLLVTCSSPRLGNQTPQSDRQPPVSLHQMELEIIRLVNAYRRDHGLPNLRANDAMNAQADRHSVNMARGRVPLSHQGFAERIQKIREQTGVKGRSGENVAEGYRTAQEVVTAWIKSPGHRKHLLGHFDLTGVGIARAKDGKLYFTQLFIALENKAR